MSIGEIDGDIHQCRWLLTTDNTSAVTVLIDFGGDGTIKISNNYKFQYMILLDIAKIKKNCPETIALLKEYFLSKE